MRASTAMATMNWLGSSSINWLCKLSSLGTELIGIPEQALSRPAPTRPTSQRAARPRRALADQSHLATQGHLAAQVILGTLLPYQRALGAALTLVPVMLLCVGLWHARSCFLLFASGQVFSGQAVRRLRQLGCARIRSR